MNNSPQTAVYVAKEKKALKTTKIIIMALLVCLVPRLLTCFLVLLHIFKRGSNIINFVVVLFCFYINSFSDLILYAIRYCYRNKTFQRT